jgi:WD40 repeat protein
VLATTSILFLLVTVAIVAALSALRLQKEQEATRRQLQLTEQAENKEREANKAGRLQLYQAKLAQARASRWSGRAGRRFESLNAAREAARLLPTLELNTEEVAKAVIELRNEVIAALALLDLGPAVQWREATPGTRRDSLLLDPKLERYADFDAPGGISIHHKQDGQAPAEFARPSHHVQKRFSPDGRYLLATFLAGRVFVWDLNRPSAAAQTNFTAVPDSSHPAAFSPDSRSLAVAGRDQRFHFYDLGSGEEYLQFKSGGTAYRVEFDPAGEFLAVLLGRELQLWQMSRRDKVRSLAHRANGTLLAWHPEGRFVAVGYDNGDLLLWDSSTGESRPLVGHAQYVSSLAFDPRGEFLASDSWDGMPRFWDAPSGRPLFEMERGGSVQASLDGERISFLREGGGIGSQEVVRSSVFRALSSVHTKHPHLLDVDLSHDGRWLAFGERAGWHLWDLPRRKEVAVIRSNQVARPVFHPGRHFVVTSSHDELLRWPLESSSSGGVRVGPPEVLISAPGSEFQRVRFSRDGELMAVAGHRRSLLMNWQQPTQQVAFAQRLRQSDVSLSPDKRWVAAASFGGIGVTVWNTRDGALAWHLITNENATVAFSPDGRTLATATARECVFWDTDSWQARHQFTYDLVGEVAVPIVFSPNGEWIAVAARREEIHLVDARSGEEVATLLPPVRNNLRELAFSGDGRYLAAHTLVSTVHLWDLHALRRELATMNLAW